ncbi:LOW QUALITY PROTEIN: hypothetical protein HID58_055982 [Brassica napus]|uniref:Leucine-rich repeat-containing N-terminal plant-type domain-containing protein n=1 Tax=Brassica napus TaxID=3708 RepID=A0ABQ8AM49_BRANA|nr:LOW QUALITY PROTEIN: hypothetical protein HID58_055982 [Brassica napus]
MLCVPQEKIIMRTYERYWWWVKKKKQMALVLFMIVTLMLQLQMKGCVGCLETERMGLLQLKNGFKVEEESMLKSWSHDDPSSDCCHWKRVKCSDATTGGHVVHLSLDELIPASYELENQSPNLSLFHSFPRLQNLKLSFNKFSDLFDPINVLTGMPMLQELDLSNNGFTDFDKLGVMLPSSLHVLNLANNQLPSTPKGYLKICALMNFRELDLSSNALTNTPYCLANLSRLRTLDLSENKISGDLSSFVPGLPSTLEYLSLFDNDFNGSFWFSSLANHTRLTVFKLSTKLGTIQTQAESSWLPPFQLKILKLKKFNLGSTIPSFLAHQHDLRSGLIYGSLPEDIGIVFPHLRYMNFSSNHNHGTIPSSMGEMKSLEFLDMSSNYQIVLKLSNNQLQGKVFPRHANLTSLVWLFLDGNRFGGSLEQDMSHNSFSGSIPRNFNVSSLRELRLHSNEFMGSVPSYLFKAKGLQVLDLWHNRISGMILNTIGKTSDLGVLLLGNNSFQTHIPENICMKHIKVIFFAICMVWICQATNYPIPVEVWDLKNIISLIFSSNCLIGSIPDSISNLKNLESLDLSNNKLHGNIPPQLADLNNLGYFNVSYNDLSGEIPFKAHLVTFEATSYIGNDQLCGLPTNKNFEKQFKEEEEEEEEGDGLIDMVWFYWTSGGVFISTSLTHAGPVNGFIALICSFIVFKALKDVSCATDSMMGSVQGILLPVC